MKQLAVRFEKEQFEVIDFLPVFMQWSRRVHPALSAAIPSYAGPITIRTFVHPILMAIGIQVVWQSFKFIVHGQPFSLRDALIGLAVIFVVVLTLRSFNNWRVRRYAAKQARDIMQKVLPECTRVGLSRKERIRRVSPWFEPVGLFLSSEPGMQGLVVAVLSPTDPKLFFVRDTLVVSLRT